MTFRLVLVLVLSTFSYASEVALKDALHKANLDELVPKITDKIVTITYPYSEEYPLSYDIKKGLFTDYENDKKYGFTIANQKVYVGEVKENQPDGVGFQTGHTYRYTGQWKAGKYNGLGRLDQDRTGYFYVGTWKEGRRVGKGHMQFLWRIFLDKSSPKKYRLGFPPSELNLEEVYLHIEYEGNFVNDKAQGKGLCRVDRGKKQVCYFKNGVLASNLVLNSGIVFRGFK